MTKHQIPGTREAPMEVSRVGRQPAIPMASNVRRETPGLPL